MCGIVSFRLWRYFFSDARISEQLEKEVSVDGLVVNPRTRKVDPALLEKIKALDPLEIKLYGFVKKSMMPLIICLGVNDTIAVFGMAMALITTNREAVIPFAAASLALNAFMFPRLHRVASRAMNLNRGY